MKIISRYILKEHFGPFVFALTALTSLMLLQYIARRFGDLVGKGLSWQIITEFLLLSVPFTVAMTFPMAVLVAVLYAFSRLGAENEITALKAGGVSARRLLNPVLVASAVVSMGMIGFNDQILPRSNHRLQRLTSAIFQTKPTFVLREGVINAVGDRQFYLRAGDIDQSSGLMRDVIIDDLTDPSKRRTLIADSGTLELAPNRRDITMWLYDGYMISIPTEKPGQLSRMYYKRNRIAVPDVIKEFQQTQKAGSKGDREMSVCEMQDKLVTATAGLEKRESDLRQAEWFERRVQKGVEEPEPTRVLGPPPTGIGHHYCQFTIQLQGWIAKARATMGVKKAAAATLAPAWLAEPDPQAGPPGVARSPAADSAQRADSIRRADSTRLADSTQQAAGMPPVATPPVPEIRSPTLAIAEAGSRLQLAQMDYQAALEYRNRFLIEIHKKFALATACIVLALVGAPIALRFPRGGVGLVLGVSFTIFAIYYVCLIGGETLANRALLTPWVSMWLANGVFLLVGLLLYARMGHEAATTRGGDAGQMLAKIQSRLMRMGLLSPTHLDERA